MKSTKGTGNMNRYKCQIYAAMAGIHAYTEQYFMNTYIKSKNYLSYTYKTLLCTYKLFIMCVRDIIVHVLDTIMYE